MIADGLIVEYTVNTGELYDRLGKLFASPTVTKNSSAPVELNANDLLFKGQVSLG